MHVLIVDDAATTRRIIAGMLSKLGFAITEAGDGKAGLAQLDEHRCPDLAIVDWNMPELDGLGFVRAVRAQRAYDRMLILMVTTQVDKPRVIEALAAGANEYLMKPFTPEMMSEKLALLGMTRT